MAENVEYRAENSLAEYETMKSIKLFDDNEIKLIEFLLMQIKRILQSIILFLLGK